jgi:hypothetical protein
MIVRRVTSLAVAIAAVLFVLWAGALPAYAQATRTWVSGVGDDANPCSRTAPCKTFAGAISKTAAGGEINALDPGGYGAVTITKSITIDGSGTFAGVLVSGTNAINIPTAGVAVTLRNLTIDGLSTGLNGVNVTAAVAVNIDNCRIFGFTQSAVNATASGSIVWVHDSDLRFSSVGVDVHAGATVFLDRVRVEQSYTGVRAAGTNAIVYLNNSTITGNTFGLTSDPDNQINSFGNNRISGNSNNGNPSSTIPTR